MPDDLMILLSGPLATRAPLLAALANDGIDVDQTHEPHGLLDDEPGTGWICTRHGDLEHVRAHADRAGWSLRMHWNTPRCGACGGAGKANGPEGHGACLHCGGKGRTPKPAPSREDQLAATVADLQRRLAALESRG